MFAVFRGYFIVFSLGLAGCIQVDNVSVSPFSCASPLQIIGTGGGGRYIVTVGQSSSASAVATHYVETYQDFEFVWANESCGCFVASFSASTARALQCDQSVVAIHVDAADRPF